MRVPISASSALKQLSPRRNLGNSFFSNNRYNYLKETDAPSSPTGNRDRSRSQSVKRKNPEGNSYASIASNGLSRPQPAFFPSDNLLEAAEVGVAKVKSICDKVISDLSATTVDPVIITALSDICEAIRLNTQIQDDILKYRSSASLQHTSNMVTLGAIPKKPRSDTLSQVNTNIITGKPSSVTVTVSEADLAKQKFVEAIRDAERSTLIFNLNMGTVPLMNKDTMATKATLSLTSMAAAREGKNSSIPSDDSVAAIDDVLSLASDMSFYGRVTKSYKNSKDPKSGSFCTIPVKYSFKDKDTRMHAENILRDRCKVNCTVPYPAILRECMKQVMDKVKDKYKDNFVRVSIDTNRMGFKVARRPPRGNEDSPWQVYDHLIPIPPEALDVSARKAPDGFRMLFSFDSPTKGMELDQRSTRLSRKDSHELSPTNSPK